LRRRLLATLTGGVALVLLAGAARIVTETPPALRVSRLLATTVPFPGKAPELAWPPAGEAAAGVAGLGAVGSSGGDVAMPIASLAKIMTAYLVLRDYPLPVGKAGFRVTISEADVADYHARLTQQESILAVADGEVLTEAQLLEALMLPSANNVAALLAAHDAGSEQAFVAKMNATARQLGMVHTTYTDPSGYDSTTVSTASDQLRLATVAMRNDELVHIVAMPAVTLPVAGVVRNFDYLLGHGGFVGVKTGSESSSGGCFVFAARREVAGRAVTILGVVLGIDRGQSGTEALVSAALAASSRLADSLAGALAVRTVVPAGTPVLEVVGAQGRRVRVSTTTAVRRLGWGAMAVAVRLRARAVGRGLTAGEQVAVVSVADGSPAATPADATATMPSLSFGWRLSHLL
jgi:D-alanyl-D-alanine carboxypeptidase (penicillin-binding protein 5/6)